MSFAEALAAPVRERGRYYDEFEPGAVFEHHWGRTLTESDNLHLTLSTVHYNPLYFNAETACANGHPTTPLNPYLVFCTVLGLTVEDLSEMGGAFLGIEDMKFLAPVYPGATLTARSTVVGRRPSSKNPGFGIATWLTEGFIDNGKVKVLEYRRSNMVVMRGGGE